MNVMWDRQADETEIWYARFTLYLYMGPNRTVAGTHRFATTLLATGVAKEAAWGQLGSWRRAAKRHQWQARAAAYDAACGGAVASDECPQAVAGEAMQPTWREEDRLRMVAELLHQVYGVLRHADLLTLSKEEARQLLPTFRLFFRDLLHFYQSQVQMLAESEGRAGLETSADELVKLVSERDELQRVVAEMRRVADAMASEPLWRPLRDVLAQLYADEASARRIAAQAQLDSARIYFSARAVDSWHAILTEAAHTGVVERVIAVVEQEYGSSAELARAVRDYRQAVAPATGRRREAKMRGKA